MRRRGSGRKDQRSLPPGCRPSRNAPIGTQQGVLPFAGGTSMSVSPSLATQFAPRIAPPFRADHVGSLLRPKELQAARAAWKAGTMTHDALREVEDRCITAAITQQEAIGLRAATDGEYRRAYWHF